MFSGPHTFGLELIDFGAFYTTTLFYLQPV